MKRVSKYWAGVRVEQWSGGGRERSGNASGKRANELANWQTASALMLYVTYVFFSISFLVITVRLRKIW